MIIVQLAPIRSQPVEEIKTSDLKPYRENTEDPYVTAYLKAVNPTSEFIIGDSKWYNSEKERFFNHPLKENTSYIVFLRFFESQVNVLCFIYCQLVIN